MIVKRDFKTYEEAAKEAKALLWEQRKDREQLTTIDRSRFDENKKRLPFAYIEDKETGATAYIYSFDEDKDYSITFLSGDEAKEENRTYPFRGVAKERIPFLMALRTPIFKPLREIKPDEALTPDSLKEINTFLGADTEEAKFIYGFLTKEEVEAKGYTIDTAFEYLEKKDGTIEVVSLLCLPFPQALTELTGVKIKTASDYVKGISKLLRVELTEEQIKGAKGSFSFYCSDALLRYAIYEFFRTESYSHLREVLSTFKDFYLSENWEEDSTIYHGYSELSGEHSATEICVLAKYLSKWNDNIKGLQTRIKEVAEYTGTPLALMSKASKIKHIYDF